MGPRRRLLMALAVLGRVSQAEAGGVSTTVKVHHFEASGSLAEIQTTMPFEPFQGCTTVTLRIRYQSWRWWWYDDVGVTKEGHRQALALLETAAKSGNPIDFGVMGEGLKAIKDAPCTFQSNGLRILHESGQSTVYSFYKWP